MIDVNSVVNPVQKLDTDYMLPVPKRQTLASQQRQYQKLVTPFRSPLLLKNQDFLYEKDISALASPSDSEQACDGSNRKEGGHLLNCSSRSGARWSGPAAQFKSPIIRSGNIELEDRLAIRLTPAVQVLKHRLQLLRRAVKVKEDDNDEALERLVKKWTEAGQEAAHELWGLVKNTNDVQNALSDPAHLWSRGVSSTITDTHWGWDRPADENESTSMKQEDEKSTTQTASDEEERPPNTMGTMLRQLRIDPETLGWDDETETFLD